MIVRTVEELRALCVLIRDGGVEWVALDTETYGPTKDWRDGESARIVDPLTALPAGLSIAFSVTDRRSVPSTLAEAWLNAARSPTDGIATVSFYLPVHHMGLALPKDAVREFLAALYTMTIRVWLHNATYDQMTVGNFMGAGIWPHKLGDTMVLAWLTGQGVPTKREGKTVYLHGLKALAQHHFRYKMASYEDTVGKGTVTVGGVSDQEVADFVAQQYLQELSTAGRVTQKALQALGKRAAALAEKRVTRPRQACDLPAEKIEKYAREDALYTLFLAQKLAPILVEWGLVGVFDSVEMETVRVLVDMYRTGILVDTGNFEAMQGELRERTRLLEQEWANLVGCPISSAKQCRAALFDMDEVAA